MLMKKYGCLSAVFLVLSVFLCGCRDGRNGEIILIGSSGAGEETSAPMSGGGALAANGAEVAAADDASLESGRERVLIRVYVCGAVVSPGVVEMPEESRIEDALSAAGGFSPEAAREAVNLADWVRDGQMIYFPTTEEMETAGVSLQTGQLFGEADAPAGERLVNINTADKALLCTLPGIGEARAADIIAYREAHGSFASCEELMQVTGIKAGVYEKICDKITVR